METKHTRKGNKRRVLNNRGSALVAAMVTMTVLILLGVAVVTLSMGTLKTNMADVHTNNTYYAGESSINSAIEQIKYETGSYYADMQSASGGTYTTLYNDFFSALRSNAQQNFSEPEIHGLTTETTFSNGSYDAVNDVGEIVITSTATAADGTTYVVKGSVFIKRVDVSGSSTSNWIIGDAAIKAGGTLSLGKKNGVGVTNGDIIVSELTYTRDWLPYSISGGQLIISENVADTIIDPLSYPSYADPVIAKVDTYVTENNYTFNWSYKPEDSVGITTDDNIDIEFSSCTIDLEGTVHGKGNIHINNGTFYPDFYSDGDMHINNCSVYGDVYCRGDLMINNANVYGRVFCDGFIDFHNGSLNNTAASGGGITMHNATCNGSLYSAGEVNVYQVGINGGIVYSSTKLILGDFSASAVFFSGGDIELTHSLSITGCVIAKDDIYFKTDSNKDMTVNFSQTTVDNVVYDEDNAFFFTSTESQELDEDVFVDSTVSAVGRVN
jgi:hypothetical protein